MFCHISLQAHCGRSEAFSNRSSSTQKEVVHFNAKAIRAHTEVKVKNEAMQDGRASETPPYRSLKIDDLQMQLINGKKGTSVSFP
jgi:hypothetical protein